MRGRVIEELARRRRERWHDEDVDIGESAIIVVLQAISAIAR